MATSAREANQQNAKKKVPLFPLLSLLCFTSIFLLLSQFRNTTTPPTSHSLRTFQIDHHTHRDSCDYSHGTWIYDAYMTPTYDNTCKEIFKGWNCISSNKSNAPQLAKWRWKPNGCDLPQFDPIRSVSDGQVKKWRPAGADRGFTFFPYNLTIAYHRTNLLARYGRWSANGNDGALEALGFKEGYRVDVDVPESTWAQAPSFHDILIFNTGHWWWAPSKFDPEKSPMLFFKKGQPVIPPILPDQGLDMVLEHMIPYVEEKARPGAVKFFRTQSPRHFEGGDWDQGGSCRKDRPLSTEQVEELFSVKNNGTNVEVRLVNDHLYKALKGAGFIILDITRLSEFRADAHPGSAGGKKHDDCMHWCLPGLTDTWNDLFVEHLNSVKRRS
ncbi:PMR5 N-terminal domain [Sesbania bispinosa]|nr:PMR5 N-terminal domain [Sesbania bispinosa]